MDQLSLFGLEAPANAPVKQKPKALKPKPRKLKAIAPVAVASPKAAAGVSGEIKEIIKVLPGGTLWQVEGIDCMAYVSNANIASQLLNIDRRHLAKHAMATYTDQKGKICAWQVRFERQSWNKAVKLLAGGA